jgi:hypothetical protein
MYISFLYIHSVLLRTHRNFDGLIIHPRSDTDTPTRVFSHSQLQNRDSEVQYMKAYILTVFVATETVQNGIQNG